MAQQKGAQPPYFPFAFPLSRQSWQAFEVTTLLGGDQKDLSFRIRQLAQKINSKRLPSAPEEGALPAETLLALRTINEALRHVASQYFLKDNPGSLERGRRHSADRMGSNALDGLFSAFVELFPPVEVAAKGEEVPRFLQRSAPPVSGLDQANIELLMLFLNVANPAAKTARPMFDDQELRQRATYIPFITNLEEYLEEKESPGSQGESIFHLLRSPMLASPDSLAGQIDHIRRHWAHLLPDELLEKLQLALDQFQEMDTHRLAQYGPPPVLEFGPGSYGYTEAQPEPEAFSQDAAWMSNVVLMAKSVHVWLDQLSKWYQRPIRSLADIPDEELDRLGRWGVSGLWLIGLWERSDASRLIKQYMGNPDAAASAYALRDYHISPELGGHQAYENLRDRAAQRGIRLASDMVPNHMGIDSRWVMEHPEWFLQSDHPPFPAYQFTGGDLSGTPGVSIRIEDGYWNHSDASVVFQRVDHSSGQVRYIYHGNDGTSMPWNDTAQLNFLLPEVREAVIQVILSVARMFPIIRFDAAMTLAKKHFQRLWYPAPGDAGAIPSRAEHGMSKPAFDEVFPVEFWREVVDRVGREVPDTLLLAEAFWLMEGYFVRTLGMHRVYNSAFMNMLKMEDNQKYRQTIKNVLEFSPPVLQRFVNFMNNPDEKTAVEQFGRGDKYFGCCLLLVTMPGLPMLGHGQIEGFSEKYGMEYRRAMWEEVVDEDLVRRHEREIFPLMRRRSLFSGAHNFALYDFQQDGHFVDENVFAYSNRNGQDRALIIFNNSYESTSGRIHLSSAINTGSADAPDLHQRSLAQALDLPADDTLWCAFRDHIDGLEYLRSCRELKEQGFHTHLRGYQFRALVDFRFMADTEGQWSGLAAHLQGGGVPSLDQALRAREVSPAIAQLLKWVPEELLVSLEAFSGHSEGEDKEEKEETLQDPPVWDLPEDLVALVKDLEHLGQEPVPDSLGRQARKDLTKIRRTLVGSRLLQSLYLAGLLRILPSAGGSVEKFSLADRQLNAGDRPLVLAALQDHVSAWTGHDYAAWSTVLLADIMARFPRVAKDLKLGKTGWMKSLLTDEGVRQYLGVHTHDHKQWLRQESLETLLDGFVLAAIGHEETEEPEDLTPALDARALLLAAATKAGYNLTLFEEGL